MSLFLLSFFHRGIEQLFEDRQKFVACISQPEEKMAVIDFSGCVRGKNQRLFAPLGVSFISGKWEFSGKV